MQISIRKSFLALGAAVLATVCLGIPSWGSQKSSGQATNVTFNYTAKFSNGATLPAGTYWIEVSANSSTPDVTFSKGHKVVTTIKAKVVSQEKKNADTVVDTVDAGGNAQLVTAIHPGGWQETLDFESAGQ
jgi:hypothetical protein